jgi:sulfide:quinone oxidoreductase
LTAAELERRGAPGAELAVVTPESNPVGFFGSKASAAVGSLLKSGGIEFIRRRTPSPLSRAGSPCDRAGFSQRTGSSRWRAWRHPRFAGLPQDANGFIPVDTHGRVVGLDTVYAVGDATSFPVKQGGIASQQADAAAEAIAATAGASVEVRPFRPVLRGLLLTGGVPRYLRSPLAGGYGDSSLVSPEPLWWPPAKIAGRHLAPALAELTDTHLPEPNVEDSAAVPVTVELPADPDPAWVSRSSRLGV